MPPPIVRFRIISIQFILLFYRFINSMQRLILPVSLLFILSCSLSSCTQNNGTANVVVDTIETDFFEELNSANAVKIFQGNRTCLDCDGILTSLRINEDSLSFTLTENYLDSINSDSTAILSGFIQRHDSTEGQSAWLELFNQQDSIATHYFLVSGDTLLIRMLKQGTNFLPDSTITLRKI